MNSWTRWTRWIVLAVILGLILWDIAAYVRGGYDATISKLVLGTAWGNPIIPFAGGVLCGHLFWPQPPPPPPPPSTS